MSLEILQKSADRIKPASKTASQEYFEKKESLISSLNEQMLNREDINELVGSANITLMKDNHNNHALFIHSILSNYNSIVFTETILWVFRAYMSRGFHPNYWSASLNTWMQILKAQLSPESYTQIFPFYEWMLINVPLFTNLSEPKIK
ncbi:MAG: hypothetical protein JW729_01430 [Bacteroidales bacterium]|nr:hypothetical protein [Bacteroidales bacterium]